MSAITLQAAVSRTRPSPGGAGLIELCRVIADGLDLPKVTLRRTDPRTMVEGPESRWPSADRPGWGARRGVRELPVLLAGRQLGILGVDAGAFRRLSAEQLQVLDDVVQMLGPILELADLEREREAALVSARAHAERIAAARRQAFAERDQERRELERDLHDGAQHHLVALQMAVGLVDLQVAGGDLEAAGVGLNRLRAGIELTEQTLLSTAAGNCPPVLVDHGLVAALTSDFGSTSQQVRLVAEPDDRRRFPLAVETAAYFTCLEAVNNARKHAPGAQIVVEVSEGPQGLAFAVVDDGPGLDRSDLVDSFGLGNMRARVEAVGGKLEVLTGAGAGTAVEGFIPV